MRGNDKFIVERIEKLIRARNKFVSEGGAYFTVTLQCTFMCASSASSPHHCPSSWRRRRKPSTSSRHAAATRARRSRRLPPPQAHFVT